MASEEEIFKKRLIELAEKSFRNNQYCFTEFLGMMEQDLFFQVQNQLKHVTATMFGGREMAERMMIRFGSSQELGYEEEFPIVCLKIEPLMKKFADDFSHRDFLGAVLNLGIERGEVGDIVITDKTGYIFATEKMAPYICENLGKVKHTHVKCTYTEQLPDDVQVKSEKIMLQVSSERVDGIIAKVYHLSRSESLCLFYVKKVFLNGKCCQNNSCTVKAGDSIAVRGYGKFIYQGSVRVSKKGKLQVEVERYI